MVSIVVEPDLTLHEVYVDADAAVLPLADDDYTPCPHDEVGHIEINGVCILCGEKS